MTTTPSKSDFLTAEEIAGFVAHPLAEIFPIISEDELKELAEDIRKNGMLEQITLHEGKILDGRNRFAAAKSVGFAFRRTNFKELLCHLDPRAYVISANIKRRHLNSEQRRELIKLLLKADPNKSDRQIAATVKVDNKTVAAVRGQMEATEEIPQLDKTTGADGKSRKREGKPKGKGSGKGSKAITYQEVVDGKTARNAYHVLEEHLLDALQEINDRSSFDHADEYAQATIEKLQEKLSEMQPQAEEAA
jgi:ParB-like chromosome segregation protein Spo0J